MKNKKTLIVSAFPGCGKTYLFNKNKNSRLNILDSDSSTFDKSAFPQNYIAHISENIGKADIILVSTHKDVRDALISDEFICNKRDLGEAILILVYPTIACKYEYIDRYIERGNSEKFIGLLESQYDNWVNEMYEQEYFDIKIPLSEGMYLYDALRNRIEPPSSIDAYFDVVPTFCTKADFTIENSGYVTTKEITYN